MIPALLPKSLFTPGRLFLLVSGLWMALFAAQQVWDLPPGVDLFRRVVAFGWMVGAAVLAGLAIARHRLAFLWRVRRKLILSYVFFGVVPVLLVVAFVVAGGVLIYVTVASYVFQEGYADAVENVLQSAETVAIELSRDPAGAQLAAERRYSNMAGLFPNLSLAVVSVPGAQTTRRERYPLVAAGPWAHGPPPAGVPDWLSGSSGFTGTLVQDAAGAPGEPALVIRAVVPTGDRTRLIIADLPVDGTVKARLRDRTATTVGQVTVTGCGAGLPAPDGAGRRIRALFRETVALLPCTRWEDGGLGEVSVQLAAPVGALYNQIAAVNSTGAMGSLGGTWDVFVQVLVVLGALFLIVQASALVIGVVLARSITSAVHELFAGTERIQQGDFAHRIAIGSRDQLGDLALSFNRMSASVEHLLHVQREKQRLDDELRIAREIQKSLLPVQPPVMAGLDIADLCEPAREVGGDYYDFFELGPRQLGVLIADVSGKGTSAALYMAELKGLMLALSHSSPSPRDLLIEVNQRLAGHLDNRSFITMTYATLDLERGTLTSARAGHTPLLVVSGGQADVIVPDGMVLGLRLPGAEARFEQVLEEHTRAIGPGDVVVLYTDGITEAMDTAGEMFGDRALSRVITAQHELGAAGIRERVLREVKAFVGDAEPHDDMTMIVLKLTGEAG
jgi:sigma-B regulation protein RsbU (phosphoserine phosphatase)